MFLDGGDATAGGRPHIACGGQEAGRRLRDEGGQLRVGGNGWFLLIF